MIARELEVGDGQLAVGEVGIQVAVEMAQHIDLVVELPDRPLLAREAGVDERACGGEQDRAAASAGPQPTGYRTGPSHPGSPPSAPRRTPARRSYSNGPLPDQ